MPGEYTHIHRVIIDHWMADKSRIYHSATYGPYLTESAAKSAVTREMPSATRDGRKATARIERSVIIWEVIA